MPCITSGSTPHGNRWFNRDKLNCIVGSEVDRFFALLTGTETQVDGSLLEDAALALRRIREDALSPKELCICHFWLLNALCSGEWAQTVGNTLAKIVAVQWMNVSEKQLFALTSPRLYAPLLKEKCEDTSRSGFSKVASILKTAAAAAGVNLAAIVDEFLTNVERGRWHVSSSN